VVPVAFIVEDIDGDDRASLGRVVERRIVSQAQIAPQPYDLGLGHKKLIFSRHCEEQEATKQSMASRFHHGLPRRLRRLAMTN
jgi:hypothetical protein